MSEKDPNPLLRPLNDGHHTDVRPSAEDSRLGVILAFAMGDFFADVMEWSEGPEARAMQYFNREMTPIDQWTRVARALRIHGLRIVDVAWREGSKTNAPDEGQDARALTEAELAEALRRHQLKTDAAPGRALLAHPFRPCAGQDDPQHAFGVCEGPVCHAVLETRTRTATRYAVCRQPESRHIRPEPPLIEDHPFVKCWDRRCQPDVCHYGLPEKKCYAPPSRHRAMA